MVDDAGSSEADVGLANDGLAAGERADDGLAALRAELADADALPLEERLALLQRAEATVARALEGLDGL